MKNKNQGNVEEQNNGINGTTNIQLTDQEKEKGNLKKFDISKKTIKKLKARNIEYLFPVQSESYTSIYEQKDCLIQASKGSGKTLAYAIPIVEVLQNDKSVELESGRAPRALVLAPTRDIVKQISEDFQSIVNDLSIVSVYTTKKKSDDQETNISNGCDVVIGTPDRVKEYIDEEKLNVSEIKHVIIDEMDQMLESDTIENVKKILKNVFTSEQETKGQLIVFSETISDSVQKLTKKYLSTDVVKMNLLKKNTQQKPADDEENEEEQEEDEEEEENYDESATNGDSSQSVLTKQENYTTYQLSTNEEIKGVGFVFATLRKCFGEDFDAKSIVSQISFTKDFTSAVFDLPSEYDKKLKSAWKDTDRTQLGPITVLPELDESSSNGNNRGQRGGSGGGGNRNSGRSNGCFNCGKEGHRSFECPQGGGSKRNSGNRSGGGNGCFNCGKEGHKSFECTEPKKAGGGRGERSNACFNCGQDGHKSFDCTEPKKGGGGGGGRGCFNCGQEGHKSAECTEPKKAGGGGGGQSNACFNCGKDGHKSFECPEPKKGRSSFGGGNRGGGGGGRGGAGGAKRSFGGYQNSQTTGETTNKKIKFDDDD